MPVMKTIRYKELLATGLFVVGFNASASRLSEGQSPAALAASASETSAETTQPRLLLKGGVRNA
jgi:hypothetical protein